MIREQVEAALRGPGTAQERQRAVRAIRARAAAAVLRPGSWAAGDTVIQITRPARYDEVGDWLVLEDLEATRAGVALELDLPFVYRNPPTCVRQGDVVVEDPLAAARQMVAETVARF